MELFPNIGLEKAKFTLLKSCILLLFYTHLAYYYLLGSWKTTEQRRQFFVNYAKANGFDAFNGDNWYDQSRSAILSVKVTSFYFTRINKTLTFFLGCPECNFISQQ